MATKVVDRAFLSNGFGFSVRWGIDFPSAWHAYCGSHFFPKTGASPEQRAVAIRIACGSASDARTTLLANRHLWRAELQESQPLAARMAFQEKVMDCILRIKFGPQSPLHKLLLAVPDRMIVEVNSFHDNFWGVCNCGSDECQRKQTLGGNRLGKLLTRLRDEYRAIASNVQPDAVPV